LGEDHVTEHGSKVGRLERHEVQVHTCMQSVPKLTVRGFQEQVRAALHDQPLTAAGAAFSNPKLLNSNTPLLEDGATYVGSSLFLVWAQAA
ncbi:hypothetical protein, partial [Sphingomonas sp.]|uniref:tail completion protein gp17 n=1 Tax=Sphingomonas sp. TaxID=28214 RepID=UPI0025CBAF65